MTSRLSDLVLTLSRASPRRRIPHAWRRMHQAVARTPASQPTPVSSFSGDHLYAVYQDLMALDPTTAQTSRPDTNAHVQGTNDAVDGLLADYARRGNTQDFESVMSRALSAPPTELQRDLHVKAHIANASLSSHPSFPDAQRYPTGALAVLHQYEASGCFAPIKSYTRVISALFNVQTHPSSDPGLGRSAAHAQAWDLFAHMRYVAHPVPDAHLYALMIRACGLFSRPEPERALDLWMEMQENGVEPTKGAYEAAIRVCCRAGPEWLGEAMRLAREMGDRHSITGISGRGLWCALLDGCKRSGDLNRARWILAEAVRHSVDGASREDSLVDAELMTHMFHTYASYTTPFRREATRLIDRSATSKGEASAKGAQAENGSSHSDSPSSEQTQDDDVPVENVESIPSFSRLPPQTPSDVIAEARALFDRILQDRSPSTTETHNSPFLVGRFVRVELTPALLNAYLSVFYRHASIECSQEVFDSLFSESYSSRVHELRPDEHACINALERCAKAPMEERPVAARWAEDVWRRWEVMEASSLKYGKKDVGSFARLIEKAHAAMRRVLILSGDVDGALASLRTFVSRYPPNQVLQPAISRASPDASLVATTCPPKSTGVPLFARPHILSTRTVLVNPASSTSSAARPLVRLTSAALPKDDQVPPVITFGDVDLLHTRLVEHGRVKDVGYIKWVCMAYGHALRRRRDAVLRAAPAK